MNARASEMQASSSPAYRATVYRPNEFDKLLDAGNLDFKQDFSFAGYPSKRCPSWGGSPRTRLLHRLVQLLHLYSILQSTPTAFSNSRLRAFTFRSSSLFSFGT